MKEIMERLKNCPNCGGILDDEGRCMYCKSKVYDLTGMKINMDNRDVVLFKIQVNGYEVVMKGYPINVALNYEHEYQDAYSGNLHIARFRTGTNMTCNMEFQILPELGEDKHMVEIWR